MFSRSQRQKPRQQQQIHKQTSKTMTSPIHNSFISEFCKENKIKNIFFLVETLGSLCENILDKMLLTGRLHAFSYCFFIFDLLEDNRPKDLSNNFVLRCSHISCNFPFVHYALRISLGTFSILLLFYCTIQLFD